jgi:hypothetical protein
MVTADIKFSEAASRERSPAAWRNDDRITDRPRDWWRQSGPHTTRRLHQCSAHSRAAFQTPDLRKKLLFTLGIIALFRLGSTSSDPGCELRREFRHCMQQRARTTSSTVSSTCSAVARCCSFRVFALGIMPYITASIIIQLLTVVIPRLEALKEEGRPVRQQMTQYTRYLTIGLGHPAVDRHHRPGSHTRSTLPGLQRDS